MMFATLTILCVPAAGLLAEPPALPTTPAAVQQVLYARPFTLEQGYEFAWRKEKPTVTEGYILVLKVDPALVYPRQTAEPVLYIGDTTAQRVNVGYPSGSVVVIVPCKVADFDLQKTLIWFGTPELPERCTAGTIAEERAKAEKAGIQPPSAATVDAARAEGGEPLSVKDAYELQRQVAPLIKQYAPDESERADNLLAPRVEEKKR
ncbi:MAG TPA: hypothetical protein PKK06_15080 [Phycisphaerae bacterium]|nr:hypothetical protein [Phycisphaerae bacterium]